MHHHLSILHLRMQKHLQRQRRAQLVKGYALTDNIVNPEDHPDHLGSQQELLSLGDQWVVYVLRSHIYLVSTVQKHDARGTHHFHPCQDSRYPIEGCFP